MGQFKHVTRRNLPMLYIIANNGVYGLTKGQFSATAEEGLALKKQGQNRYVPVDIVWEAIAGRASFVARSFSGDPKQLKTLIKAGIHHRGIAVIDVISPCVTFNNEDESFHSYAWGKSHEVALHELSFVPPVKPIKVDYPEGETLDVPLYDGTHIVLKKLAQDYEPTDRALALKMLEEANDRNELITGLIYINPKQKALFDLYNLPETALNRLESAKLRPGRETLEEINQLMS
jgi:2-oxoglutarate ferredoxin oxidoreductase subunit beta